MTVTTTVAEGSGSVDTALEAGFGKPYFRKLKDFLISDEKSQVVYPPVLTKILDLLSQRHLMVIEVDSLRLCQSYCNRPIIVLSMFTARIHTIMSTKHMVSTRIFDDHEYSTVLKAPLFRIVFLRSATNKTARLPEEHLQLETTLRRYPILHATKDWASRFYINTFNKIKILFLSTITHRTPHIFPFYIRDLSSLAEAGVLWLNTVLTVRAHKANSHAKKGRESLTDAVIKAVLERGDGRGVVFFAWGLPAQQTIGRLGIDKTQWDLEKTSSLEHIKLGFRRPYPHPNISS
ncbi:hypothetical protein HYDPIDRAFT_168492 [Hydnomerulius pinastri MD-312]|uniref:Unplaced genomic scaffold scaffold_17, whole genome shotgun sequence n=1 Tax=Hydnomerulius pinastri MD-312 TaxID=994086 RepID=A0A0C9WEE5_9AGAM|nr:hypothetical protein HYDPIDRAFT_168492 [Hydnomerulius pinastri MD-312]